jgi:hypothetical protein
LKTDRSLTRFRGQLVPLKVTTSGQEWFKWASKYPASGRSIPKIYIVRADGKMLYGKSGSLSGNLLPALLTEAATQAGRSFNNEQYAFLSSVVTKSKAALASEDLAAASRALSDLNKLGKPGQLSVGSYSTLAKEADEMTNKLIESGKATIQQASDQLTSPDTAFEGALSLVETERIYKTLPTVKKAASLSIRAANKDSATSALLKQAADLDRARYLSKLTTSTSQKRAITSYEVVIRLYPGTAADKLARTELAVLAPASELLGSTPKSNPAPAAAEYRIWTDSTGNFRVEAKLVSFFADQAELLKKDGKTITLPLDRLSADDQKFLQK